MLGRRDVLNVEMYIMGLAVQNNIKTKEDLEMFSENIHQIIENALMDYANDENIEDYEPQFWVKVIFSLQTRTYKAQKNFLNHSSFF